MILSLSFSQEDNQQPLCGPGWYHHGVVRVHRRPGGWLSASLAQGHKHAEDLYHRGGSHEEEVTVHPDQAASGENLAEVQRGKAHCMCSEELCLPGTDLTLNSLFDCPIAGTRGRLCVWGRFELLAMLSCQDWRPAAHLEQFSIERVVLGQCSAAELMADQSRSKYRTKGPILFLCYFGIIRAG